MKSKIVGSSCVQIYTSNEKGTIYLFILFVVSCNFFCNVVVKKAQINLSSPGSLFCSLPFTLFLLTVQAVLLLYNIFFFL